MNKTLKTAEQIHSDYSKASMLLYGLSDIIKSQVELYGLDNRDLTDAEAHDLISRHAYLGEVLNHVAISLDHALEQLDSVGLYTEEVV